MGAEQRSRAWNTMFGWLLGGTKAWKKVTMKMTHHGLRSASFLFFYLLFLAVTVPGFSAGQVYPSSFSQTVILLLRRSQNTPNSVSDGLDEDAMRFSAINPPLGRFQYSGR